MQCLNCDGELNYDLTYYTCKECGTVYTPFVVEKERDKKEQTVLRNIVYMQIIRKKEIIGGNLLFYDYNPFDDTGDKTEFSKATTSSINLYEAMGLYPVTISGRIDEILLNIVQIFPSVGVFFPISLSDYRMLLCDSYNYAGEIAFLINMMSDLQYLYWEKDSLDASIYRCQITLKGWKRIEQLSDTDRFSKQAFLAMKFGTETEDIAEAMEKAIIRAGYFPYKMDEIEHNNQIVPEMFYQIRNSRFMVVDATIENLGAYYEAGYAQALGKQVVVCCRRGEKVHFDISQKNIIHWDDYDELEAKLFRRIEATIGVNSFTKDVNGKKGT